MSTTPIKNVDVYDFNDSQSLMEYVSQMIDKGYDGSAITSLTPNAIQDIINAWKTDSKKSPLLLTIDYATWKLGLMFYGKTTPGYRNSTWFNTHNSFPVTRHPDAPKIIPKEEPKVEITSVDGVKIYKTTEDNIVVQQGDKLMFLDNAWEKFSWTPESHGSPTAALRKDSAPVSYTHLTLPTNREV